MPQNDQGYLDFGVIARTALGMGNLMETRRAHDLQEQNMQQQAEQFTLSNALSREKETRQAEQFKTQAELSRERIFLEQEQQKTEQQKARLDATKTAFTELQKIKENPALSLNRRAQIDLTYQQADIMKRGLGLDVPLPSKDEMEGGYEEMDALLTRMHDPKVSAGEKAAAFDRAMVSNPAWAGKLLDDMKKTTELSTQMEQKQLMLETNRAKLEQLNAKNGRINAEQGILTEHVGGIGRVIGMTQDPQYKEHFDKLHSFTDKEGNPNPLAQQAYLNMHPDFKQSVEKVLIDDKIRLTMDNELLRENIGTQRRAVASYISTHEGQAPTGMEEEIVLAENIYRARSAEQAWIEGVMSGRYDKKALVAMKGQHEALRIEARIRGDKKQAIADDRMKVLQENKFDETKRVNQWKEQSELKTTQVQTRMLKYIQAGEPDNQAFTHAVEDMDKEMPGIPVDIGKVKNLEKAHTLEITTATRGEQEKNVLSANLTEQTIADLEREVIAHPEAVGAVGNFKRWLGGYAQQAFDQGRAAFGSDPNINPKARGMLEEMFTDTDTEDKIQAFSIGLTYNVARQLSGSGVMSDMDVKAAKDLVGGLKNASGSRQFMNHLNVIKTEMRRRSGQAKQTLSTGKIPGVPSPGGGGPQQDAPTNADEYLKMLGIGQ